MKASNQYSYFSLAVNWMLRVFFRFLYNQLAWIYDWVAGLVSLGLWNKWILTTVPFLNHDPILEIGHGTGHLQLALLESRRRVFGLDLSETMGKIVRKRLRRREKQPTLIRGTGMHLPFPDNYFASLVATFPSEYIANRQTLEESWRVLQKDGYLVILPYAWITGNRWLEKIANWLFQITNQVPKTLQNDESPAGILGGWLQELVRRAEQVGFLVSNEEVTLQSSRVLIIIARKMEISAK
jgi:ubiquinone/menaquinone biosynthesis C-methylase UbiE